MGHAHVDAAPRIGFELTARVRQRAPQRREASPVQIGQIDAVVANERCHRRGAAPHVAPSPAVVHELPADGQQRVARRRIRHVLGPPDARGDVAADEAAKDRQQRRLGAGRAHDDQLHAVARGRRPEREDADRRRRRRARRFAVAVLEHDHARRMARGNLFDRYAADERGHVAAGGGCRTAEDDQV